MGSSCSSWASSKWGTRLLAAAGLFTRQWDCKREEKTERRNEKANELKNGCKKGVKVELEGACCHFINMFLLLTASPS